MPRRTFSPSGLLAWSVGVALAFVACATTGDVSSTPRHRLYVNPVHGWSVWYPADWRLDDRNPVFVQIQAPSRLPRGQIGFHSARLAPFMSLDDFAQRMVGVERPREGFEMVYWRRLTLSDGTPAIDVINLLGVGVVGKSRKVFVEAGPMKFALNAETYRESWTELEPYFDRIIMSFEVQR
jgi:hypothetical protein